MDPLPCGGQLASFALTVDGVSPLPLESLAHLLGLAGADVDPLTHGSWLTSFANMADGAPPLPSG